MSAEKVRELNDTFRTTMTGGHVVMTAGVGALASDVKAMVIRRVQSGDGSFDPSGRCRKVNSLRSLRGLSSSRAFRHSHFPSCLASASVMGSVRTTFVPVMPKLKITFPSSGKI